MMKKTLIILAALLLAFSCTQQRLPSREISYHTAFNVTLQSAAQGDLVGVYGSVAGVNEKYTLSEGLMYGPKVEGEKILAYYPYSSFNASNIFAVEVLLPSSQTYNTNPQEVYASVSPQVGAYSEETDEITLGYPFAQISFLVKLDVTLHSLEVRSASKALSGVAHVGSDLSVVLSELSSNKITLCCPPGGVATSVSSPTAFAVLCPAGTYERGDLTVTLTFEETPGVLETMEFVCTQEVTLAPVSSGEINVVGLSVTSQGLPQMSLVEEELEFYR